MLIMVSIKGITPLILNKFTDKAALEASGGTRGSSAGGDRGTPREIAASKLYLDEAGKICIPQPNILRCIVMGGIHHKIGKKQVTTRDSSLVYSCLDIRGAMLPLRYKEPWVVDTRPVVIPATKGRILTHRPMFHDWGLDFEMELQTEIIGVNFMRKIVDDAGKKEGLGDFRVGRKGPYGKWVVVRWKEQAQPTDVAPLAEAAE